MRDVLEASLKQLGGGAQASSCPAFGRGVCHTRETERLDEDLAVSAHRLPPVAGTAGYVVGGAAVDAALFDKILQRMLLPPASRPQTRDGVGGYGGEVGWSRRLFEMLPAPPQKTHARLLQALLHPSPQASITLPCACLNRACVASVRAVRETARRAKAWLLGVLRGLVPLAVALRLGCLTCLALFASRVCLVCLSVRAEAATALGHARHAQDQSVLSSLHALLDLLCDGLPKSMPAWACVREHERVSGLRGKRRGVGREREV